MFLRALLRRLPSSTSTSKRAGNLSPATLATVAQKLERLGRVVAGVARAAQRRRVDPRIINSLAKLEGRFSSTVAVLGQVREATVRAKPRAPNLRTV